MRVIGISIPVSDQQKALEFYTEKLGFVKKRDIPVGEGNRWLTVVSKDSQSGPEILLEPAPLHFEAAKVYQDALMNAGIPCTQIDVDSVDAEFKRLTDLGVAFTVEPKVMDNFKYAVFNDSCGNLIQIVENL